MNGSAFEDAKKKPRDLWFTAGLFGAALLPRLYAAIAWAREPVWDGHYYAFGARRIAAGLGYSDDVVIGGTALWHPWCHYPVGYSAFLGLIYKLFGTGQWVAPVANALTGALLVCVVHRLARYAISPARARIAGVLAALSPGLVVYAALLMTEPLAALLLMAAAWLFTRDIAERPLRAVLLSGVVFGLSVLVRPQTLLCVPGLFWIAKSRSSAVSPPADPKPTFVAPLFRWLFHLGPNVRAGLFCAATLSVSLLCVAPWTLRNCRVMDGCAFVSTNGGWNLAIGAFPRATGRFETLRPGDGCPIVTGQVQQDRCWMQEGIRWIRQDPMRWVALIPKKLAYTFDHESFPMGYLGEADPKAWPEARKALGRQILGISHAVLLCVSPFAFLTFSFERRGLRALFSKPNLVQAAAALALIFLMIWGLGSEPITLWRIAPAAVILAYLPLPGAPRREGVLLYLAWALATVCITHAVFFGEDRYHIVITPALCILGASAWRAERPRGG